MISFLAQILEEHTLIPRSISVVKGNEKDMVIPTTDAMVEEKIVIGTSDDKL